MKKLLVYILLANVVLYQLSCNRKDTNAEITNDSALVYKDSSRISDQQILEIISSIPNPIEISLLLQKCGVIYSAELLNPTENIKKYNTNYKKALNLGVYGTDLVHMNIYDRTTSSLQYLNNIKEIANDLKIGQFFDHATLTRLSENAKNVDSILFITNTGFDKMNHFLQEQNRTNISVLIGIGTWIESLYLATNIEKATNKEDVYKRVGEQKEVLDMILIMLSVYKKSPEFNALLEDFKVLKKEYDKVKITYTYAEPTMKEVNGMLVVVDNSTSTVEISEETFNNIKNIVSNIRNKIIS